MKNNSSDILSTDIQGVVVQNYLSEQKSTDDKLLTSSDTVNELLRGFSSTNSSEESILKLSKETESVLPSFSKVLENSTGWFVYIFFFCLSHFFSDKSESQDVQMTRKSASTEVILYSLFF